MNVKPRNYSWPQFYDHIIDLTKYTFSWRSIYNRHRATGDLIPKWMNFVRAISSEGFGRISYHTEIRRRLDTDMPLRRFFESETAEVPDFYTDRVRKQLGPMWEWLPAGAMDHDPNAYLKSEEERLLHPTNGGTKKLIKESLLAANPF